MKSAKASSSIRAITPRDLPSWPSIFSDLRPPLEAQLIDLADEIAYNTADLDDGFEAHLLYVKKMRKGVAVFGRFYREIARLLQRPREAKVQRDPEARPQPPGR